MGLFVTQNNRLDNDRVHLEVVHLSKWTLQI